MDDLRAEIRAAFEKEQSEYPAGGELRPDITGATATHPRRAASLQWAAIIAAFLIAVLVVVGLMSSRLINRGAVGPRATSPAATSTPGTDYGPPPLGVNLIWVHDPQNPAWLVGYDWSGKPRATVKPDPRDAGGMVMAPDGQSFAKGIDAKGGDWQFFDRLGQFRSVPDIDGLSPYSTMWADDSKHVCAVTHDQATYTYSLWMTEVGLAPTRIAQVARDTDLAEFGGRQSTIWLAACSVRNDEVIVVRTSVETPIEVWIIRPSDGKSLARNSYMRVSAVVASADGKYLAESVSSPPNAAGIGPSTQIRRVSDSKVVARIDGSWVPARFSGDDSRLLLSSPPPVTGGSARYSDVEWSTGRMLWTQDVQTHPGGYVAVELVAEPDGQAFVVAPVEAAGESSPLFQVMILQGDGTEIDLPDRYAIAF